MPILVEKPQFFFVFFFLGGGGGGGISKMFLILPVLLFYVGVCALKWISRLNLSILKLWNNTDLIMAKGSFSL